MLRRTFILAPLLLASTALPAQERAAVTSPSSSRSVTCPAGMCAASTCGAATCSGGSLSLSSPSVTAPVSMEISSWSWGASQSSASPRDSASGLATGKRQHKPVSVSRSSSSSSAACTADAPCPGGGIVHLSMAGGRKGWDGCVKGSHIASAQLSARGGSGKVSLSDLHVMSCDDGSGRAVLSYGAASTDASTSTSTR